MKGQWSIQTIGALLKLRKDSIRPDEFNEQAYIGLEHIGQGTFLLENVGSASEVTSNKYRFEAGDILYGKIRPYFRKAYQPNFAGICSTDALVLRTKDSHILDQSYAYHLIKTQWFTDKAVETSTGTKMPRADWNSLCKIEVDLPPLPEQKAIAAILGALDDKIELNLQMNKTLEEMAMTHYKHWFVDFGPFQDGEFVDSELGPIPEGWEVKKLDDITEVVTKGTTPRKSDVDGKTTEVPFLKVRDISDIGQIDYSDMELIPQDVHEKQLKRSILKKDDLLFTIAGTIGRVSQVNERLNGANCNQAVALIRLQNPGEHFTIVNQQLKSQRIQTDINRSIVQAVQANVSLGVLKDLEFLFPHSEVLEQYEAQVQPMYNLIFSNSEENIWLSGLRDTILPKLISGEIRVKDAEKEVANAL